MNDYYRTAGRSNYVLSYLIDDVSQDFPTLDREWYELGDSTLRDLLAEVESCRDNGGAYFDGSTYAPLAEKIEAELDMRAYDASDPGVIAAMQASEDALYLDR